MVLFPVTVFTSTSSRYNSNCSAGASAEVSISQAKETDLAVTPVTLRLVGAVGAATGVH